MWRVCIWSAALSLVLGSPAGPQRAARGEEPRRGPDDGRGRDPVRRFDAGRFFGDLVDRTRRATPAESLRLPTGFRAELLYTVPAEQGSWVCLTGDPQGRLIASAQSGKLYRIAPCRRAARRPRPASSRSTWTSATPRGSSSRSTASMSS